MTRHANRWGLVLLCSLHSLAAPSRWAARAAAPPYQDAELFEMPWTPPMHPFDDKEPFKAAVVGNKILWHHREDSLVITQSLPLNGAAKPRACRTPPVPYPGRPDPVGLTFTASSYGSFPLRWHATKDSLYIAAPRSIGGGNDYLRRYPLEGLVAGKVKHDFEARFTENSPGRAAWWLISGSRFDAGVFYDYLPDGEDGALLFLLTNTRGKIAAKGGTGLVGAFSIIQTEEEKDNPRWSFTLHRCRSKFDKKRGVWEPGPWEKVKDLPVPPFKEQFHALRKGDDFFFLTASGKLFVSPKPAEGKCREVRYVHDDRERPVEGIIVAPKEGKTFLFVRAGRRKGPAFFELSDKPKLEEYDPKAAKRPKGERPLRDIMHKARVLVALGKLKGK